MVYWSAVHRAIRKHTGVIIGKTAAIKIAKDLNAAIKRQPTPCPR